MQKNDHAIEQAMQLAKTPAGQQFIRKLQQQGGEALQQAMTKAASGDFAQAKQLLSALLEDPEMKKILEQMGG